VAGYAFPDRDLHPARCIKIKLDALTPRSEEIGAVGFCDISVASQNPTALIFLQHLFVKDDEM